LLILLAFAIGPVSFQAAFRAGRFSAPLAICARA
jgi:hypothetical protein